MKARVNPKSTSNQSSKPCTVLQYPSKKVYWCQRVRVSLRSVWRQDNFFGSRPQPLLQTCIDKDTGVRECECLEECLKSVRREVGGWGRDPKKCTGSECLWGVSEECESENHSDLWLVLTLKTLSHSDDTLMTLWLVLTLAHSLALSLSVSLSFPRKHTHELWFQFKCVCMSHMSVVYADTQTLMSIWPWNEKGSKSFFRSPSSCTHRQMLGYQKVWYILLLSIIYAILTPYTKSPVQPSSSCKLKRVWGCQKVV